ncbi:FeoB-associated Cys-rich membrane protein [Planctomycetales bacterium ZRK34]|nr:FeoB-associated Cys-rich membrane protein [Planctomycetales bacterium ZRK34]
MTGEQIIIAIIIALAAAYLLRLMWKKYISKSAGCGCGCGPKLPLKGKRTSLTLNGRSVRR